MANPPPYCANETGAAPLDCDGPLTDEHFISHRMLKLLEGTPGKKIRVRGIDPKNPTDERRVSPANVVGSVLCRRHNSALRPIDTAGNTFFETVGALRAWLPSASSGLAAMAFLLRRGPRVPIPSGPCPTSPPLHRGDAQRRPVGRDGNGIDDLQSSSTARTRPHAAKVLRARQVGESEAGPVQRHENKRELRGATRGRIGRRSQDRVRRDVLALQEVVSALTLRWPTKHRRDPTARILCGFRCHPDEPCRPSRIPKSRCPKFLDRPSPMATSSHGRATTRRPRKFRHLTRLRRR